MCATCGCGDDGAVITPAGQAAAHHHHTHDPHDPRRPRPRPHPRPHPRRPHPRPHRDRVPRTEGARQERSGGRREPAVARRTRHPGVQPHQLTRRGQDHPARTHHPGPRPGPPDRRHRGRSGDAPRRRPHPAAGARAVQINTGAGCHLDAEMVRRALDALDPDRGTLLFIENVGNLVCPAMFDLGEHSKVVVISVTEGADKPLKYPHMFAAAGLVHREQDRPVALCRLRCRRLLGPRPLGQPGPRHPARCRRRRAMVPPHWYAWIADLANLDQVGYVTRSR